MSSFHAASTIAMLVQVNQDRERGGSSFLISEMSRVTSLNSEAILPISDCAPEVKASSISPVIFKSVCMVFVPYTAALARAPMLRYVS